MSLRAEDVAHYLQANPQFFEDYAELMSQLVIPHPHGGRAISITERQMLALRDRNKSLEGKLSELVGYGESNDVISERMHRLAVGLVAARNLSEVLRVVHYQLREDFAVPHVAVCLWDPVAEAELPPFVVVDDTLQVLGETLNQQPYCGTTQGFETERWFTVAAGRAKSQALIALREGDATFGMLALGSEDVERFYHDMGTLYLERLGELLSGALLRSLSRA